MAHKKYIKRGNKVFGPYVYENYRVNGITKTKYLGKPEKGKENSKNTKKFFYCIGIIFLVCLIIILAFFLNRWLTGKVSLELSPSYAFNEIVKGELELNLRYGELIPADTQVKVLLAGQEKIMLLSQLVYESTLSGNFYAEGMEIQGSGEGYGALGEKITENGIEYGFGNEYLTDDIKKLSIDLENFQITAENGNLEASLIYDTQEIAKESIAIAVEPSAEENKSESEENTASEQIKPLAGQFEIFQAGESQNISNCSNLNESGATYYLNASINNYVGKSCMNIMADNVTLDCQGNMIDGIDLDWTTAINNTGGFDYVTIKNCKITDFKFPIYFVDADYGSIIYNNLSSNTAFSIYLNQNCNYNTIADNNASSSAIGILLTNSSHNIIANNTANLNSQGGIQLGVSSNNNTLLNNIANSNSQPGILLNGFNYNNLIVNNTANFNTDIGISIDEGNNTISNNTANNNQYGAEVSGLNNILISNTFNSNRWGIDVSSLSNNTIIALNNIYNNTMDGIRIESGFNDTITGNNISSNGNYGILISYSSNFTLTNNNILKLNGQGLGFYGNRLEHFQHDIDTSNTINGLPINYYDGINRICPDNQNLNLGSSYSYFGAVGCTNISVTASNTLDSVLLANVTNSTISKINASNSMLGFYILFSLNNTFINNIANSNGDSGFWVTLDSDYNRFISNIANSNVYGMYFDANSNDNIILSNTANSNEDSGIFLSDCYHNIFMDNIANSNVYDGFYISRTNFSIFTNNSVNLNSDSGVVIDSCSNIYLISNIVNFNANLGIYLLSSSNNTLANNTANSNSYGISLESDSNNNTITNNTANSNSQSGIFLWFGLNNNLTNNIANSNSIGIHLLSSSDNTLALSIVNSNLDYGIYLDSNSLSNNLISNTASSNFYGIILSSNANYNTVTSNNASSNSDSGIIIESSNFNNFTNNTINENTAHGISSTGSSYNNFFDNNATLNQDSGMYFTTSSNNKLVNNTANLNTNYGIYFWDSGFDTNSGFNVIDNNFVNSNTNNYGIWIQGNYNNNLTFNTVTLNSGGIWIQSSSNNLLFSNCVNDSLDNGIVLQSSTYNNLIGNEASNTLNNGIYLNADSNYNNLTSNTASNNSAGEGFIIATNSNYNNLIDNTANLNIDGIVLASSSNNALLGNMANLNNDFGIRLLSSLDNILANNTANSNTNGIQLSPDANNNILIGNTANSNPDTGIVINSDSNTLISNNVSLCGSGIVLGNSFNNTLASNKVDSNEIGITLVGGGPNNIITNNTANSNTDTGIYISSSSNNTLANNIAQNNVQWDFYSQMNSLNNTVINFTSYQNLITFTSKDVALKGMLSSEVNHADSSGQGNISKYFNLTNNSADSWIFLNMSYLDTDWQNAGITDENSLKIWKYNESSNQWIDSGFYDASGINEAGNYVYANISSFSIFGVFGTLVIPVPQITINSPINKTYNIQQILVNITALNAQAVWWWNGTGEQNITYSQATWYNFTEESHILVAYANNSAGEINQTNVAFSVNTTIDLTAPTILLTSISPYAPIVGENVALNMSADDNVGISEIFANITLPNGSVLKLPMPGEYNVTIPGQHNVTFFAIDVYDNLASMQDYFVAGSGKVNFTVIVINDEMNYIGVNLTYFVTGTDKLVHFHSFNGVLHDNRTNILYDLLFRTYNGDLIVRMEGVNLSILANRTFGFQKLDAPLAGYLANYVINNSCPITNAVIKISYNSTSYSNETNLKVHKCDNYEFTGKNCISGFNEINATQNTSEKMFTFNVTSFSAFAIKDIVFAPEAEKAVSGGGFWIFPAKIEASPDKLNVNVLIQQESLKKLIIKNIEKVSLSIAVELEGVEDIVTIDKIISVGPEEEKEITLKILAKEKGVYAGKIILKRAGINVILKEIPIIINVQPVSPLFDLVLELANESKKISFGEKLIAKITLLQLGLKQSIEVNATYIIMDFSGNKYMEIKEVFNVLDKKEYAKEFDVSMLKPGNYVLGIEVDYEGGFATASSQFEVKSRYIPYWRIIFAVGLIFIIWILIKNIFAKRKIGKLRKKKR